MTFAMIGAAAAEPAPAFMRFLPLIVLAAAYFAWFRPRMKKVQAERSRASSFEIGDVVQTVGGLVGTAVSEVDGVVRVRTASGVELDFIRRAIAGKYTAPGSAEPQNSNDESQES